jgi:hypothetical protein
VQTCARIFFSPFCAGRIVPMRFLQTLRHILQCVYRMISQGSDCEVHVLPLKIWVNLDPLTITHAIHMNTSLHLFFVDRCRQNVQYDTRKSMISRGSIYETMNLK